jgi:UDP-glucose 4-epimerase
METLETLKNKTILVTGGAGFLGSHLCEQLSKLEANVICLDDFSQGKKANVAHIQSQKFSLVDGDCNKLASITSVFKAHTVDYVFHYAATVGVKRTIEDPLAVLEDIEGIRNILSLAKEQGVKKVVFASSSEVYGEPSELPEKESNKLNPEFPYALVKLLGEKYCQAYWDMYKLPTVSLRFFNVYGPRQEASDYGFVVGIFMRQILEEKSPTIFGDGSQTRNFVFIQDNINAAIQALLSDKANGESINIGTGTPITVLELAKEIIKLSGKTLAPVFLAKREQGEIMHRYPDVTKMEKLLNYKPQFSLQEGLQRTYDWYKASSEK